MTDHVKSLGRSRSKRQRGKTETPTGQTAAAAEFAQSPDLAKFMSAFGMLKGKSVFGDDAVKFQQEMRDEWR